MKVKNLILQKNDKYEVGGNKPYFRLCLPPEEDGGKWTDLGAFWLKEKNGKKYYSGSIAKEIELTVVLDQDPVDEKDIPFD